MSRKVLAATVTLLVLAGCSPEPEQAAQSGQTSRSAHIPMQAQVDRFLAEGPEPTLEKMRSLDYWLHYKVMQATGIEKDLGGEAQAVAALRRVCRR